MELITSLLAGLWESSGFALLTWQNLVMIGVAFVFLFLAIAKKFEPLLLVPIAVGMLLTNFLGGELINMELFNDPAGLDIGKIFNMFHLTRVVMLLLKQLK